MNPYTVALDVAPGILAVAAALLNQRVLRIAVLAFASLCYWAILVRSVDWAYSNPVNASDGGPKAFASVFGWAIGLISPILPVYFAVRGVRYWMNAVRTRKT